MLTKQDILDSNYIEKNQKTIYRHHNNPFLQVCKVGKLYKFRAYGVTIEVVKNIKHLLTLTAEYMKY